jgi:hypothetical protein
VRTAELSPAPTAIDGRGAGGRGRRVAAAAAGPVLIVASVVFALRGFVFWNALTNQHPDILSFWLPRSCLMGRSLASGHVPLWNPFEMAGTPFAADPQSGWLYAPWMLASWLFGCGGGLRAFIVLQPMLAGLGLFWFLRRERLGRVAATAGGLSLAMSVAASNIGISLPFSGSIAWTPFVLVGASGYFDARGWRRAGWLALAAFAWGQVAAAHLSHGLVVCTALAAAYVVARAVRDVRERRTGPWAVVALAVAFLAFLPLANLALLIPHFALTDRSSLRGGYASLRRTLARVVGTDPQGRPLPTTGMASGWPFQLAATPGAYVGALMLLCAPAAFRTRERRFVAAALLGVAVVAYLLTLNLFVAAGWFRDLVLRLPFGDVYLHNPDRLRYAATIVVPALGAIGLQGFFEHPPARREAAWWLGGAALVSIGLPIALGADPVRFVLAAAGAAASAYALLSLWRGKRWARLGVPAVLAVDLLAGAVWSTTYSGGTVFLGLEGRRVSGAVAIDDDRSGIPPQPLRWPDVPLDSYLTPGPIARTIAAQGPDDGRYLAWIPPAAYFNKGYLFTQGPNDWPALLLGRAVVLGLHDVLGYSPIELPRYWGYIRATNRLPVFYNAAVIQLPSMQDVWLLGVRYLIEANGVAPTIPGDPRPAVAGRVVATERGYRLIEVDGWESRVSVVPDWTVEPSGAGALRAVLDPSFDPGRTAVIERPPGIEPTPGASGGSATYDETWPEDVRVSVDAASPSIVLVRNAWDIGWSATVDGRPAPVLRTDYFLQGVPVPPGRHEIRLVYRDPRIGQGLLGSAVAWLVLVLVAVAAFARARRRRDTSASAGTAA